MKDQKILFSSFIILLLGIGVSMGESGALHRGLSVNTKSDLDYYNSLRARKDSITSLSYTVLNSFLNNGVLRVESKQKNIESRLDGFMRSETSLITENMEWDTPSIMLYDEKKGEGFYKRGAVLVRAPEDELGRMMKSLHASYKPESKERYQILNVGAVKYKNKDVEVFNRFSWASEPGHWSTVWIDKETGMIIKSVEFDKYGMLHLREIVGLEINIKTTEKEFKNGFHTSEDLPILSFVDFVKKAEMTGNAK